MQWVKRGRIFNVDGQFEWMMHYANMPSPDLLDDGRVRIYFGARDAAGQTRPGFIEADARDPETVRFVHDRPALDLGKLGTFDDSGATPSCLVTVGATKYLYYVGWNRRVTVPYSLAIGVAVSTDGGSVFTRVFEGPVVDRTAEEPHLATAPFVAHENGVWRMWYVSGTGWIEVDGHPEPLYEVKYAESADGFSWRRDNITCIASQSPTEAIARPWVVRDKSGYRMWYCYRGSVGYRTDPRESYRIGYAESGDGIRWQRKDEEAGIGVSASGWDSQMIEYPSVYQNEGTTHLLYNGNGFGESGIGHATLETG